MLRVALTGGIACGKSRVLGRLAQAGLHTIDLDAIAHDVIRKGDPAYSAVVEAFGPGVLDAGGEIDRKALGARVFGDTSARLRLNAIVHPRILAEEARRVGGLLEKHDAVIVTDGAVLVEAGFHLRFHRLVVVHCEPGLQLERLMARDGIGASAARARVDAQMPLSEKRRFAHFDIDTSGSLEATDSQADALAIRLRRLAGEPRARVHVSIARAAGALVYGPRRGPRGLDPERLLSEIALARGVEMQRLARLLTPPPQEPWYRAAHPGEAGPGPETLAVPLVLWALSRVGPDPELVASAALSLAWLTHHDPQAAATACFQALAVCAVAVGGGVPADFPERAKEWRSQAERWAGAFPAARAEAALDAAVRHPSEVDRARDAAGARGGDPDLAGALVGMAIGTSLDCAPRPLVESLRLLTQDSVSSA